MTPVYCLEVYGKKCAINEVVIKTGEGQETLVPAAVLKKLNSAYISAALRWNLNARAAEEKIMPDKVDLIKQPLKLDLTNISSSSFSLIMRFLETENPTIFLKSLSEKEMEEVFIILDFLQADEEFFAPVIRADVNKKQAWKNYDGSEDAYKYYVHNKKYQEILKRELVQKLKLTHFALSQMKENPIALRHGGPIRSVAIATNNSFVVTGSEDGTAKIWRLDEGHNLTGEPITLMHENWITSVAIAIDNSFVVTGSSDETAKIWRLGEEHNLTGEPITLRGHENWITSVAIATNNSFVVTGSWDKTAKIWRLDEERNVVGEPITLRGHGGGIASVALATDNSFVVTGSSDGTAKIWRGLKEINALDLELPQILLLLKLATSDSKIDLSKETEEFRAIYESLPENVKTAFDEYNRRSWWSKIKRPLAVGSIIAAAYLGYKLFKK